MTVDNKTDGFFYIFSRRKSVLSVFHINGIRFRSSSAMIKPSWLRHKVLLSHPRLLHHQHRKQNQRHHHRQPLYRKFLRPHQHQTPNRLRILKKAMSKVRKFKKRTKTNPINNGKEMRTEQEMMNVLNPLKRFEFLPNF